MENNEQPPIEKVIEQPEVQPEVQPTAEDTQDLERQKIAMKENVESSKAFMEGLPDGDFEPRKITTPPAPVLITPEGKEIEIPAEGLPEDEEPESEDGETPQDESQARTSRLSKKAKLATIKKAIEAQEIVKKEVLSLIYEFRNAEHENRAQATIEALEKKIYAKVQLTQEELVLLVYSQKYLLESKNAAKSIADESALPKDEQDEAVTLAVELMEEYGIDVSPLLALAAIIIVPWIIGTVSAFRQSTPYLPQEAMVKYHQEQQKHAKK